jgi:hypothetical protein
MKLAAYAFLTSLATLLLGALVLLFFAMPVTVKAQTHADLCRPFSETIRERLENHPDLLTTVYQYEGARRYVANLNERFNSNFDFDFIAVMQSIRTDDLIVVMAVLPHPETGELSICGVGWMISTDHHLEANAAVVGEPI